MDSNLVNILVMGLGFMLVFTPFQTLSLLQKTWTNSIHEEDPSYMADGYVSLCIIYFFFSFGNWFTPSFIGVTGPRASILVGATLYVAYIISFFWPVNFLLYAASVVLGLGAAVIWNAQGAFLARCSTPETVGRNSGIFWAVLQCSMFFGNLFVFFQFQNKGHIDADTRRLVLIVFTVVAIAGIACFSLLRYVPPTAARPELDGLSNFGQAVYALKAAGRLFFTRNMLLLCVCFVYTGLELTFYSGVYGSAVGFTKNIYETPKQILGLVGICIGVGEVLGGAIFGILGHKTNRFGRDPIVILGYVVHMVTFFLIFLNLPNEAPFGDTDDISFLDPPLPWLALLSAFLLGFGDACFNTQCYSILGGVYREDSVGAFGLFKFTQSAACAISFFYSGLLGLRGQLAILVIMGTLGTVCFVIVEWDAKRRARDSSEDSQDSQDSKK